MITDSESVEGEGDIVKDKWKGQEIVEWNYLDFFFF